MKFGLWLFGPSNSSFYKLLDFCLEPIRFKGPKTTTIYTDTAIYLVSPGCIEGHRKLAFQPPVKPELVAQHWGEATRTYVLDWLTASMTYDVCLLRLETYNYPMQIYRYHKAILLRLLDRQQDLKAFASEWEQSLTTGSALIRRNSLTFIDRVTHADLHGLIAPAG